jgi:hypothetical protein
MNSAKNRLFRVCSLAFLVSLAGCVFPGGGYDDYAPAPYDNYVVQAAEQDFVFFNNDTYIMTPGPNGERQPILYGHGDLRQQGWARHNELHQVMQRHGGQLPPQRYNGQPNNQQPRYGNDSQNRQFQQNNQQPRHENDSQNHQFQQNNQQQRHENDSQNHQSQPDNQQHYGSDPRGAQSHGMPPNGQQSNGNGQRPNGQQANGQQSNGQRPNSQQSNGQQNRNHGQQSNKSRNQNRSGKK